MTASTEHADVVPAGSWRVDPERSEVGFTAKSFWGLSTVRGTFRACDGTLSVGAHEMTGELAIDVSSLDTGNPRRDRHLRSPDFFDAERHRWIRVRVAGAGVALGAQTLTGTLCIGDTDTRIELPVDVEHIPGDAVRLEVTTTVSRTAAGISWNWLGMIPDQTMLRARVTVTRGEQPDRDSVS